MFFVKTGKRELRVSFVHVTDRPRPQSFRATQCIIKDRAGVVASGTTYCHPKDNFNKNTGRKISMARALKDLTDSPTMRKLFWDAYAEKRGGFD